MTNNSEITIITSTDESNTKGGMPFGPSFKQKIAVRPEILSENLNVFLTSFNQIIESQPEKLSKGFYIDEIELSLSVNASGGIELIGKAEAGVEGGIKVKLKRGK